MSPDPLNRALGEPSARCGDFLIYPVYRRIGSDLAERILALWASHRALPEGGDPRRRLAHVVSVAADAAGELVAVNSAVPVRLFDRPYLSYRLFIRPHLGAPELKFAMSRSAHELLRDYPWDERPAGLAMILQTPRLRSAAVRDQLLLHGFRPAGMTRRRAPIYLYDYG